MSVTKQLTRRPFRTNLDEEVPALPGRSVKSVLELFGHLENLAVSRERPSAGSRKGSAASRPYGTITNNHFGKVSFRDLGLQVLRAAQGQVRLLQTRLNEVQSLVLINDWAVAERLWAGLLPECKTPLFELSILEELWGISPDQLQVNGWTLTRQWHQFVLLQAEVEVLLGRRRSLVALSDTLERDLGLWLKHFADLLEKIEETSAA
jgi:hypothetical protein